MAELTPEERAALWQAGMLDVEAHNENPNQYEKKLDLVQFGDTKIGPGHPYYEEAKKYSETFSKERAKFLAEDIPDGPSTDADFRDLDLRLKELPQQQCGFNQPQEPSPSPSAISELTYRQKEPPRRGQGLQNF